MNMSKTAAKGGQLMWHYRKVGGIRFLSIWRLRISFCIANKRTAT